MKTRYFKKGAGIKITKEDLYDPEANIINNHNENILTKELKTLIKLQKNNISNNIRGSGLKKKPIDTSVLLK